MNFVEYEWVVGWFVLRLGKSGGFSGRYFLIFSIFSSIHVGFVIITFVLFLLTSSSHNVQVRLNGKGWVGKMLVEVD